MEPRPSTPLLVISHPEPAAPRALPANLRGVVVKVGTNLLTGGTDRLSLPALAGLAAQLAALHARGLELLLVSSGAVAAGRERLGDTGRDRGIPHRQILAAVGQSALMGRYEELFSWYHITIAQTLLTRADIADRQRYLNARNTLLALLDRRVLPIANENDVVAFHELAEDRFGDNDTLSALVAHLVDADLLVILTDIDGLHTADPRRDPEAAPIPFVAEIDAAIERLAGGSTSGRGLGGMATKVRAAKLATSSGIGVILADGQERDVLARLLASEPLGTYFAPTAGRLEGRKRWLLGGASRRGTIYIDAGAASALRAQG